MYTFSSKLKTFSIVLMILGILGIGYGFLTAPKNIQDVEKILAAEEHHEGAGHTEAEAHEANAEATHVTPAAEPVMEKSMDTIHKDSTAMATATSHHAADSSGTVTAEGRHELAQGNDPTFSEQTNPAPITRVHVEPGNGEDTHAAHQAHLEHVLHQLQNKPWAAVYVPLIFFMLISLGVLAFYAIQIASQAGWSPVLFRVMQGITAYLPVASVIFFIFLILCGMHFNHLFPWLAEGVTDSKSPNYDEMIAGKSGYLNFGFWIIRALIFLIGWNLYRFFTRKNCLAQDASDDNSNYKKNFKLSAAFLVFFIVSESIMSWDWIMSVDPHWFSTLFGWYVFASFIVSAITTICMVTLYLKSRGFLPEVNTSHIHDLAKFMFGFSVFWTYLWFSQFMLIWYANIPEEVTYYVTRINDFTITFWGAVVMNFVFPILILVNTDFKRVTWILVGAGTIILVGHYIDFFNMIMPATVGQQWFIGITEISAVLFFLGLFILVVFTALTKSPLVLKRSPFIEESKHFHY
ncbi:MAG: quinol:cytochrome C oxidoreductase [Flavobacterium sp.]|nr:MAG: quinol:cytochrome C oxidoreductase [Flavobacterium sp.]